MGMLDRSDDDRDIGWGEGGAYDDEDVGAGTDEPREGGQASGGDGPDLRWLREQRPPHHVDRDSS